MRTHVVARMRDDAIAVALHGRHDPMRALRPAAAGERVLPMAGSDRASRFALQELERLLMTLPIPQGRQARPERSGHGG